jgi:hypothetical protein
MSRYKARIENCDGFGTVNTTNEVLLKANIGGERGAPEGGKAHLNQHATESLVQRTGVLRA